MTFVQYLGQMGIKAVSQVQHQGEVIFIQGETFLYRELGNSPYSFEHKAYLSSNK